MCVFGQFFHCCDQGRPHMTQNMYKPCIIRQYIHSKTAANHALFSKFIAFTSVGFHLLHNILAIITWIKNYCSLNKSRPFTKFNIHYFSCNDLYEKLPNASFRTRRSSFLIHLYHLDNCDEAHFSYTVNTSHYWWKINL